MATVHDVARYILRKQGSMSTWKLQKLVYYAQAWHLVWEDEPLFPEPIEAWANGPVVRELYNEHRGRYSVSDHPPGKVRNLTAEEKESIDAVLGYYGEKSGHWLSQLTHNEDPWRKAREGLPEGRRGNKRITRRSMIDFYTPLAQ